jgi:hypothetical protein
MKERVKRENGRGKPGSGFDGLEVLEDGVLDDGFRGFLGGGLGNVESLEALCARDVGYRDLLHLGRFELRPLELDGLFRILGERT